MLSLPILLSILKFILLAYFWAWISQCLLKYSLFPVLHGRSSEKQESSGEGVGSSVCLSGWTQCHHRRTAGGKHPEESLTGGSTMYVRFNLDGYVFSSWSFSQYPLHRGLKATDDRRTEYRVAYVCTRKFTAVTMGLVHVLLSYQTLSPYKLHICYKNTQLCHMALLLQLCHLMKFNSQSAFQCWNILFVQEWHLYPFNRKKFGVCLGKLVSCPSNNSTSSL